MEILIEIIVEFYLEMMMWIVPEKNLTKKQRRIAELAAATVAVGLLALVIWGIILISDYGNLWGFMPIAVAAVLALAQITAGVILQGKNKD